MHLIDLLYRRDGGRRPEVIITDTGSYSDVVFGLLQLLGFDYRPQLADLPDGKLWRINRTADYGPSTRPPAGSSTSTGSAGPGPTCCASQGESVGGQRSCRQWRAIWAVVR